ncbi:hypothetical protein T03_12740 [Trichinella britovi]|uniref:Uncharacterized protein n=1 Tax=Trichinella britovi TaxID=45882 RepID=A0A0V1DFC6_TRIBR|nr:hypothetical protein T03_12740 [Trichinella britovi]
MRLKLAMGNRAKSLTVSPCYLSLINLTNEVTSAVNSGAFSIVGGGNLKSKLALSICTHAAEAEIGLFIIVKVVFPCSYPSVKFLSVGVQKVAKETDRPSKLGSAEQLQGTNCVPVDELPSVQVLAAFFTQPDTTEPKLEKHDRL